MKYSIGDKVFFKAYESDMQPDECVFKKNDELTIIGIDRSSGYYEVKGERGTGFVTDSEFRSKKLKSISKKGESKMTEKSKTKKKTTSKKQTTKTKGKSKAPSVNTLKKERNSTFKQMVRRDFEDGSYLYYTPEVDSIIQGVSSGKELSTVASDLNKEANRTFFRLGGVLSHIFYNKTFQESGFENFQSYCDADNTLDINYRRAMYLINIYETFTRLGIDEDRLNKVGWTKCKDIIKYVNEDNVDNLLSAAQVQTVNGLKKYIEDNQEDLQIPEGKVSQSVNKKVFKFKYEESDAAVISQALDLSSEVSGAETPEQAFMSMAVEYIQYQNNIQNNNTIEDSEEVEEESSEESKPKKKKKIKRSKKQASAAA